MTRISPFVRDLFEPDPDSVALAKSIAETRPHPNLLHLRLLGRGHPGS